MKTARFVLKIVAAALALAAAVCAVVGFWDKISALFATHTDTADADGTAWK